MVREEEIRDRILIDGRELAETEGKKWKEKVETPFNAILCSILGGRFGDMQGNKCFESLATIAKGKIRIPDFLQSLNEEELYELFSKEVKTGWKIDVIIKAVKGLLELDRKYNLRSATLEHITEPETFYSELRKIPILRGTEIGAWIALELVRNYELKIPENITLPNSTKKGLSLLGLSPSDFSAYEYPYVDAAFEALGEEGKKIRNYVKNNPEKLKEFFEK